MKKSAVIRSMSHASLMNNVLSKSLVSSLVLVNPLLISSKIFIRIDLTTKLMFYQVSAKTGFGIELLMERICSRIPRFDDYLYDNFQGIL